MTKYFRGQEVFDQTSFENSMRRAGRMMSGHAPYLLMNEVSDETANTLADYADLRGNDRTSEAELSAALDSLLSTIIEAIDVAVSTCPDADKRILKALAARSLRSVLADGVQVLVEDAELELATLRQVESHAA